MLTLSVLEAPALQILRHAGEEDHYRAFREMTGAYFRALDSGKGDAIAEMIDFYGGAGTFAAWPQRIRDYAIATTRVNVVDWASAYGFELKPDALAAVAVPTLVLWGEASHPAVKRANELIGGSLPRSSIATIPGAAHFMISTHPAEAARAIARHLDRTANTRADDAAGVSPSLT